MRPLPLLLTLGLLGTSCGNLQNLASKARAKRQQKAMEQLAATSSEEAESRLGANALGEVAAVSDAEQFVLIRTLNGLNIPDQAGLETRRDGQRTALLRGTRERKDAFAAADLLEGTPQRGDGVFPSTAKPKPKPFRPAPPSVPEVPPAPAAVATPALPEDPIPAFSPADDLDPTNLPALKEPVKTPEDLKR